MYFTDRWPGFDSGLYNGLRMLEILSKTNLEFSKLTAGTNSYHSIPETKVRVTDDTKFNIVKDVLKYVQDKKYNYIDLDGVRVQFEDGWALVRASNTGPNLTVRYEAMTQERLKAIREEFDSVIYGTMEKYGIKR